MRELRRRSQRVRNETRRGLDEESDSADAMILLGGFISKQAQTEDSGADFDDGVLALLLELEGGLGEVLGLDGEGAGDFFRVVETFEVIFLLVYALRRDVGRGVALLEVCRSVAQSPSASNGGARAARRFTLPECKAPRSAAFVSESRLQRRRQSQP